MNISFYCRESKADRNGLAPIEVCIIIDGKRTFLATEMKVAPKEFKKAVNSKRTNTIKDFLEATRTNINQALTDLASKGKPLTTTSLKGYLKNGGIESYTIDKLFTEFLAIQKAKIGNGLTAPAFRKYETTRDLFFEHINKDFEVTAINNSVITSFYAKVSQKYAVETARGIMTRLKTITTFAFRNAYLRIDPFYLVKVKKAKPIIEYLTDEEIDLMKKAELYPKLARVRDLFIFQASTGLSYIDLQKLEVKDIQKKGEILYICKSRQKTKVDFTSVILPDGVEILEKYGDSLPKISNQKYNKYLRELQNVLKMENTLHTHLARKTYATKLSNSGVTNDVLAKCMGHSNPMITVQYYAHIETQTILNAVADTFTPS